MSLFKNYNNLGFYNPYYIKNKIPFIVKQKLNDIIPELKEELVIDPASAVSIINKNFIIGDRTLIRGIHRTPWQAVPNEEQNEWVYAQIPCHKKKQISEEEIAEHLFESICNEIEFYIGVKKKVGVLLSGGMDSRMVAGALDFLIRLGKLTQIKVTGLTWGNQDSRDVRYAKEISARLGWDWKHYAVGINELVNNISETANYGCEYSPIHLHAIPQIRDDNENDFDVILAGSYGDSVGRAEFSGKKITALRGIGHGIRNISGLFNYKIFSDALTDIKRDIHAYHVAFPTEEAYMQNEIDQELHYMRRMLNSCMDLLNEKFEFYQVFTRPDVFGFIWSIAPDKRNDLVYKFMLKMFKTDLSDIPWARTGIQYLGKDGVPDLLKKQHHSYLEIISSDILDYIGDIIETGSVNKLKVFNMENIRLMIRSVRKYPLDNLFYQEKLIWLASLSMFVEKHNINSPTGVESCRNGNSILNKTSFYSEYSYRWLRNSKIVKSVMRI